MFISVASSALDKYEWYQYLGKRTLEFTEHNRKYDLDVEPNIKYGVRKYGSSFKLVLLDEPSVLFTLSASEISKVIRLSKGWSGKVKGKKLVAGVGGKDPKEKRTVQKSPTHKKPKATITPKARNSKYFPDFPVPPKVPDIFRLYNYLNKLLFKGECPEKVDIEITERSKIRGQASCQFKGTHFAYGLLLSKSSLTDTSRITNIVAHEMIHLLHFKRLREDKNPIYDEPGHGPQFIKEMKRLNRLGYNIQIQERYIEEAEIAHPEHILIVHLKPSLDLPYRSSVDFKTQIPSILTDIESRIHSSRHVHSYTYGTSKSNYVSIGEPLTAQLQVNRDEALRGRGLRDPHLSKLKKSIRVIEKKKL